MLQKHNRFFALFFIALFVVANGLFAQTGPKALLVYADDETAIQILTSGGTIRSAYVGDEILPGETIKTLATNAELKLDPNGSIIKIARNTSFKVEGLAGSAGKDTNEFALLGGKIRTVAAKTVGSNKYQIKTPTAVCGVRGTDFSMLVVEGARDAVYVQRGLVEFAKTLADGTLQPILVGAGQFADVFGPSFIPSPFTPEQFSNDFGDIDEFKAVDPAAVPQEETTQGEEKAKSEEKTTSPVAETSTPSSETAEKPASKPAQESKLMAWLGDILGFEIGSVVIDGNTYSKAVIQPVFSIGKLKMGLYLPVIYTNDLFNPNSWYHPNGNDEWSFGSEYWNTDPTQGALDALQDLALKIRFIEYGQPLVDPLYFKVGNLSNMTIGHGVLMRNFANDADFPSVRRVGINAGYDAGPWGVEGVVNDLGKPEIFGGRIKLLSFFGVSAIADINPAGSLATQAERDSIGDPMIIGSALDLDFPILKLSFLSLRAFADVAAVAPYNRTAAGSLKEGLQYQAIYNPEYGSGFEAFRNYGFVSGFMGKALMVDWRLEYRYYRGAYRPTFFDNTYERNRVKYALDFYSLLTATNASNDVTVNGIYGEAGFSLIKDKIVFTAGYMMPWSPDSNASWDVIAQQDYILAKLVINKGLLPFYDISGAITYERTGFAYAISKGQPLVDANTIFSGEIVVPIASTVDFAVVLANNAVLTTSPTLAEPQYKTSPTITFETRIHF
ncbi:FecR family protein [Gracilinema caldarium]|uniref:FecR family protein n=1 Tax=Gracilinema caldarium TaxID=215591 RepID=UPI0026EB8F1A|nr:FecR family protein [Gracilinema caldarium]